MRVLKCSVSRRCDERRRARAKRTEPGEGAVRPGRDGTVVERGSGAGSHPRPTATAQVIRPYALAAQAQAAPSANPPQQPSGAGCA